MAFSYTVDGKPTTGLRIGTEDIFGNLVLKTGTWTAGGDTSGTIVTGLTAVLAYGTNVNTGTVTSEHTSSKSAGNVLIAVCATDNVGTWFAIGY